MKLVSIIVPVYNLEDYILYNLESLENQTYRNIEVIIINDGSTDNSLQRINDYIKGKTLTYRVFDVKNGGVSKARNIGLREAKGDYVLLLDGDDKLKLEAIENMVAKAEEYGADICHTGYEEFDDYNKPPIDRYREHLGYLSEPVPGYEALKKKLSKEIWICTGNALYSGPMLRDNNIYYSEGMAFGEDIEFIGKCLFNARKVISVTEDYTDIINRNTSAMHSKFSPKYLDALKTNRSFYNYVNKNSINISNEEIEKISIYIDFDYVNIFLGSVKKVFGEYSLLQSFKAIKRIKELDINLKGIDLGRVKNVIGTFKKVEISIFQFSKFLYFYCAKILGILKK